MKGNFQIIVMVIFIAIAIFGVLVFSGAIPIGKSDAPGGLGTVVLWGTVKSASIRPILEEFNANNPTFSVRYEEKNPETFDRDLLEAFASGTGPDMFLLPDDLAFRYADKIITFPYESYPLASFKNNFASAGEVFLNSSGILAFPVSIDPLVMYYNRSMLDASGVVYPPSYWDEVSALAPTLTKLDDSRKVIKSTTALGHFSNINHAKNIISALFMQTGNPIVRDRTGTLVSSLSEAGQSNNLEPILEFYTSFADPNQSAYSWNKSFSSSREAFSKEDLVLYFGFASELVPLINTNPNQNFSVAPFPQIRDAKFKLTGARVTGIAVASSSKNLNTAFTAASLMATGDFAAEFAEATGAAPARRDLLNIKPKDAYSPAFYDSALYAKSWLDPSPRDTDEIFRRMVEAVLSNSMTAAEAIRDASNKLSLLLLK